MWVSRKIPNKKVNEESLVLLDIKIYDEATIIKYFGTREILDTNKLNRIHIKSVWLTLKFVFQLVGGEEIIQ